MNCLQMVKATAFIAGSFVSVALLLLAGCEADSISNAAVNYANDNAVTIQDIDLGDQAWGQNTLRVRVQNQTDTEQSFWLHIGGRYQHTGHPVGFGMGMAEPVVLEANEQRIIEHLYWIPPQVGELSCRIKFVIPTGSDEPYEQTPFLEREYVVSYQTPNHRCNELTPLAQFMDYDWAERYRAGGRIEPFEVVNAEHFVFYIVPNSPAKRDIANIQSRREQALDDISDFLGVSLDEPVNFFLFPDASSKRWCMGHQGDGLAFDNTIAEIYNDDIRVDASHELTHIVASQIGSPPALFTEGLAVYMQQGHRWNDECVDITAGRLLGEGRLVPLAELIERDEIGSQPDDGVVAYPQSASFVKFLIDRYGREVLLRLYGNLQLGADDNILRFRNILGIELEAVEQEWLDALGRENVSLALQEATDECCR